MKEICGLASTSRYTWANIHKAFFAHDKEILGKKGKFLKIASKCVSV